MRLCLDGSIQQRHLWHEINGEVYDPPYVDPWISAGTRKVELAFRDMTPAPEGRAMISVLPIGNRWRWALISACGRELVWSRRTYVSDFAANRDAKRYRALFFACASVIDLGVSAI